MNYKVRLDIFEGPFDLLVYLIERAKMSIYDIQISEITTQYIEYVKHMEELDIELAQDFMVLAAELIQIKTRMLLPSEKVKDGEEYIQEDPRVELVQAFMEFILKKQRIEEMHRIYERIERQKLSMEKRISQVREILSEKNETRFSELIEGDTTNFNKVITFMSILELLKDRSITAEQKKRYGDIILRKA